MESVFATRKKVMAIVVICSLVLYGLGVISGLFASELYKEQTEQDLTNLKAETEQDLVKLKAETDSELQAIKQETERNLTEFAQYISFLDRNMRSMQIEQGFANTLTYDNECTFSRITLDNLRDDLGYYWERLPFRLEEYERYNTPTAEFEQLKQEYTYLSLRVWILAKTLHTKCNTTLVQGLTFYSRDCAECGVQGEQIDLLHTLVKKEDIDLVIFPIDADSEDSAVQNIKTHYNVTSTPAVVINDRVFQGTVTSAEEMYEAALS